MPVMRPCTPYGIVLMMERAGLEVKGRNAVVVGRSNIVGKPMALELLMKNATVTVCPSGTRDLASFVGSAEILVVSVGKAGFVPGAWVKPGAVVIDVGINRLPDGRLAETCNSTRPRSGRPYHAGSRRRRADDDRGAHEEHPRVRRKAAGSNEGDAPLIL